MMPTSGSCRRSNRRGGFSLLELLVVLALISIMVALVAPRLAGTVRAVTVSGDRADIARQIESLPLRAREHVQAMELGAEASLDTLITLPEGWQVTAVGGLRIAANGICSPATLQVSVDGSVEQWQLMQPDCKVDHAP
jgi:prepilin-type N-terminal cleavage/methylation domain-containing protein